MVSHDTIPRGAAFSAVDDERVQPTILRLTEQDFVPYFLRALAAPDGPARLAPAVQRVAGGRRPMVLEQPVHRAFHLVVVEAHCLLPTLPRLDPAKIESAGMVISRRVPKPPVVLSGRQERADRKERPALSREREDGLEGWLRQEGRIVGWRPLDLEVRNPATDYEPDAARRQARREAGSNLRLVPGLADHLPALAPFSEAVVPLFKAPPESGPVFGRTVLYGSLPLASSERSEADDEPAAPFSRADVEARVPFLLRTADGRAALQKAAGAELLPPVRRLIGPDDLAPRALPEEGGLRSLAQALTYLAQEAGAFTGEVYALPLVQALAKVDLAGADVPPSLFQFLQQAYQRLIERQDGGKAVRLPDAWPALDDDAFATLVAALESALRARWQRLRPRAARFDEAGAVYEVQAFIRIDDHPGCPPRIVWSKPSDPFTIKPWYESGEAPPVQVELPSLDPDRLKALKPNVAFKVPPEIQQLMDRINLQGLLDGKAPRSGLDFGMICGFSIPIITICAFIVLQIFLSLLHILFFWLPFVRICIPFPRIQR